MRWYLNKKEEKWTEEKCLIKLLTFFLFCTGEIIKCGIQLRKRRASRVPLFLLRLLFKLRPLCGRGRESCSSAHPDNRGAESTHKRAHTALIAEHLDGQEEQHLLTPALPPLPVDGGIR